MAITKGIQFDRGGSRDSQFNIWRISSIAGNKKLSLSCQTPRQKLPIQINDADALLDEILFHSCPAPQKRRKVHLSLKQTRILTTLLPNAIINISDFNQDCTDNFVGVLLFADISGFTALCEKYKGFGKSGTEKLTVTLNNYLGALVEVIYKHGGDVLKFSGDALLALWKLENHEYMYTLIHRVVCCALYIQRSIGVYETDVKVLLKVKLAISAGNMTFAVIGNDNSRHYLVAGLPVTEVKAAEQACASGEVVLSLSAWGHLSAVNYEYYWKDSEHVKIIRIIYNPENIKREILHSGTKDNFYKSEFHPCGGVQDVSKKKVGISTSSGEARILVEEVSKKELNSELKTFLIPSVIQQIDADLPMEYLSEMRNVTVMFVNIVPNKLNTTRLINMVDQAYIMICSLAYTAMGSVNKVSLFDKDVMVLVIFGLRGFTHEGEVAGCLKCGYDIRQACCTLDGVFSVSVGVTTGQAYCGVVGHPLRREYTVMGPVVNKAARIMCAYPGKVTCDRDTFMFSNLAASFFTIQEKKHLKGIEDTGPIYEFTREKSKNTLAAMNEGMYPILSRTNEIEIFRKALRSINKPPFWKKAILVTGHGRIGKTRLLDEMIIEAHSKGIKPIVIALHTVHSTLGYGTAQSIIKQILEIPDSASISEKEHKLSMVLNNHIALSDYWYLNEVMNVKFPQKHDGNYDIDPAGKFEEIKKLFHIILIQGTTSPIFAIDDIDFCDELSWDLLLSVIDKRIKFLIMTMPKRLRPATAKFLKFPPEIETHIIKFSLSGLPDNVLATLACQILNAKAVPVEVERILIEKSNGNPGWCESFLLSLCQSNVLKVEELPEWHIRSLGLIIPPEMYLRRKQYRPVSHSFNTVVDNEKPIRSIGNEELASGEVKPFDPPKKKSSTKTKLVRFFSGKNEARIDDYFHRTGSTVSHPEEAYEDLKQRIQQVRSKSREFGPRLFDQLETEVSDPDAPSVNEILIDKKGRIRSTIVKEPSEIHELALFGYRKFSDTSDAPLVSRMSNSFSTESLKQKVNEIHLRYLRKIPTVIEESDEEIRSEPRLQSLLNLREETKYVAKKSRSADLSFSRLGTYAVSEDTLKNDRFENAVTDPSEFSPCILWTSHTDVLISESIKLFMKNKAKREASQPSQETVENDNYPTMAVNSSAASIPVKHSFTRQIHPEAKNRFESFEFQTGESKTEEIRGSVQSHPRVRGTVPHAKTTNLIQTRQLESENPEEEKREFLGSVPSIHVRKKGSLPSIKGSRSNYDGVNVRFQEKSKGWIEKLFDWVRRHSESPVSDSYLELPMEFEDDSVMLPAILVNPRVKLDEVRTPECFIGVIMTAFDSLRPYEQLMLKCGSIIGESFTRKMLNAIMHNPNPLLMAEAVKRLFEMRILCCGSETSKSTSGNVPERQCFCTLLQGDIIDDTMPRYSFCRVLLFRYAMFRSTLYELMPLEQKREFHIRAVEFLEKEEIYCSSCERFRSQSHQFSIPVPGLSAEDGERRSLPPHIYSKRTSGFEDGVKHQINKIYKKRIDMSPLVLSSWLPSFQKCNCLVLKADTLGQLISHCVAAGLREKEIHFIMNYSSLMITLGQFGEAHRLLGEVEATMKSPHGNPFSNRKQRQLCIGRIHLLLGNLYLEIGELKKANTYLWSALKFIERGTPPSYCYGSLEYMFQYLIQIVCQRYPRPFRSPRKPAFHDYKATCLSLSCNVFMIQGKWKLAKLVALRNLNFLWMNSQNLIELCNAYSNAVDVYRHSGNFKFCRKLESAAAKRCVTEFKYTTALEVIAFGRLNCSVLNARLISGYLTAASKLGESAVKFCQSISSYEIESYTISKVSLNMMMMGKLNKAAGLILLLPVQGIWHHILSLEFILETGFAVETSDICVNAILNALNDVRSIDISTLKRAIATVYVWLSRIGEYEKAEVWRKKLPQNNLIPFPGDTIDNMLTVIKVLEGDLLILGSYPNEDFRKSYLNKKVTATVKDLRKSTKKTAIILPRFLHLRAYDQYRLGNVQKALKILAEAKEISNEQGNTLERSWISHSKKVWTNTCDFDIDFWIRSAKNDKFMKWTESHDLLSWKNYMYSLK